jgi:hypothetical protein
MSSTTLNPEQLIEETLYLAQGGFYDSIRQTSRIAQSALYHRRTGRPPGSQTTMRSARPIPRQEAIFAGWITDLHLQYLPCPAKPAYLYRRLAGFILQLLVFMSGEGHLQLAVIASTCHIL